MTTQNGITKIDQGDLDIEAKICLEQERDRRGVKGRIHSIHWQLQVGNHVTLIARGKVNSNHFLESSVTL